MLKKDLVKIAVLGVSMLFFISTGATANLTKEKKLSIASDGDLDPLVDLEVTVSIDEIWAFDEIDLIGKPDFYVKVFINDEEHKSPVWRNQKYVLANWSVTQGVPDNEENVSIKIQLWDKNVGLDKLCDISPNGDFFPSSYDVDVVYNLKTGHWSGEDYIYPEYVMADFSGYGRLNGCDDGSIYEKDLDCELLFDITQNDYDGDGIPYWMEVYEYGTDPEVDNIGEDADCDGVPIEWEWKWGVYTSPWYGEYMTFFDPFTWEDHDNFDFDSDGLDNVEEYYTSQWGSDPFRKDIFIELDQMEEGPDGEPASLLPEGSKILLRSAYNRQNIVYHLDDGCMGGGEMIPFDNNTPHEELRDFYEDYFLHGDENNWRCGVFRYSLVVYDGTFSGFCYQMDAFQISSKWVNKNILPLLLNGKDVVYASVYMHETGHLLGLNGPLIGGHNRDSYYPWQPSWWKWRTYKSCMNYGYTYFLVDYSDGSRGRNDFDDWNNIDLTVFQDYY